MWSLRVRASACALALLGAFAACGDDGVPPTGPVTSAGTGGMTTGSGGAGAGGGGQGGMGGYDGVDEKPVIYQLVVRLFGNTNESFVPNGTIDENGAGKFDDVDDKAIGEIKKLGATHVWLTGVLRQATMTDWSSIGLPADDPDTVKGRAGSFYAVRDYYDVCPDYANDPANRMAELEALVGRLHAAGLKVMIDLVPNHVARGYGSVVHPELDFGLGDDQTKFFARDNSFFYLADPPGQSLALSRPAGYDPPGIVFDGAFAREDGSAGHVPRATGNNVTSPSPSATDWYETVKLNYGFNFADPGASSYSPIPATWTKVDAILAYWQSKGIDGFRVDFAHYVPTEAWSWLLAQAKMRDPNAFLIAEAYENLDGLLGAGFDAVYRDETYDTFKRIYLGQASLDDLDTVLGKLDDPVRGLYVNYLENHDERRIASPIGTSPDDSGFGSAEAGKQLAPIALLYSQGPVIFYNGQEVGEDAAGAEGFGGDDGRTSIFDYWTMHELAYWVNGHQYDGGLLADWQKDLRSYYADLLALCQAPEIRGKRYWGLRYANVPSVHADSSSDLFPFARFATGGGSALLVIANFGLGAGTTAKIYVPEDLAIAAGLPADGFVAVELVLDSKGKNGSVVTTATRSSLANNGFSVTIPNQAAHVYRLKAAP
jgi:glycosidase